MIQFKRTVCPHDCPDTCGLLAGVENGRVVSIKGDPDHPFTQGAVCVKVRRYPERVYSPSRVLYPLKRIGPKGEGKFERISWEEALDLITHRYGEIISDFGAEAILPYSYAGTMGQVQRNAGHPFFHKLGASKLLRTICSGTVDAGFEKSMGAIPTTDIESTVDSDFIIIWGSNTISTNMHAWPFFLKAQRKGASLVTIDPYRNRTAKRSDIHLILKPGTDAALALGMMHVIIKENLVDTEFIAKHTIGFDQLIHRVNEYPLHRVEEITGVPIDQIERVARKYGRARAPYLRIGWGAARQLKGGMAVRTIALLPALAGATHKKGGGITRSTSPAFGFKKSAILHEELSPPDVRTLNMVRLGEALTEIKDPPIKAFHVYHSNPAVVAPESAKVLEGLKREDLFTVVHELLLTETALYADIVLPGTTFLETTDLYGSYGHYYMQMARPVISPLGETRTTLDIFQDLAARFGFDDEIFSETEDQIIRKLISSETPYFEGITFEALSGCRPLRLNIPEQVFSGGFGTSSRKVEFYSETMADQGEDPLPDGAPSRDEEGEGRFYLQLITPPRHQFLNSSFNDIERLRKQAGKPTLMINTKDAVNRRIEDGMKVRVYNNRGECFLFAHLTEDTAPGVVVAEGLYWPSFMPENLGINQLTSQRLTDMGESCAFHCNLVEVESAGSRS